MVCGTTKRRLRRTCRHNGDGKPIKAVAQVTKQAFVYVFDRVKGKAVWVEEQPVPASNVPGEERRRNDTNVSHQTRADRHQGRRDEDLIN